MPILICILKIKLSLKITVICTIIRLLSMFDNLDYNMGTEALEFDQRGLSLVYCLGSSILFGSALLTVIAFFSPYWTQSDYEVNHNKFANIGLWEVCFYRYRHTEINSPKFYTGCYWIWSDELEQIRDWIMTCECIYKIGHSHSNEIINHNLLIFPFC